MTYPWPRCTAGLGSLLALEVLLLSPDQPEHHPLPPCRLPGLCPWGLQSLQFLLSSMPSFAAEPWPPWLPHPSPAASAPVSGLFFFLISSRDIPTMAFWNFATLRVRFFDVSSTLP